MKKSVATNLDIPKRKPGRPKKVVKDAITTDNENLSWQEKVDDIQRKLSQYMRKLNTIKGLLQSYYLLEDDGSLADEIVLPEKKTPYWYVRSDIGRNGFVVQPTEWIGGISDRFRFANGNFFLDKKMADDVCRSKNILMEIIEDISK